MVDSLSQKAFFNAFSAPDNPILAKVKEASSIDPEYQRQKALVASGENLEHEESLMEGYFCEDGVFLL